MLEAAAVALALAYLALAIRQNIGCWAAGIASSVLYFVLLADAALYMESALQVFYIAVSLYGWWHWGRRRDDLRVHRWRWREHTVAIALVGVATVASGALLAGRTDAALPYLDAFIAWGSVLATWMVARKVLDNWTYWFVLDALSVFVYLSRGLPLTAALFVVYLVMIIFGFRAWREQLPVTA